MAASDHLQPMQFSHHEQLQMFATPHEASNWASGDTGYLVKHNAERGGVYDDSSLAAMHGPIEHPVLLTHIGPTTKVLANGNHRAAHALRTNRLLPVEHVEADSSRTAGVADPEMRDASVSRDRPWRAKHGFADDQDD